MSPLDRDEGAFLVIAQEILHGHIPYRDVFDQKPPGIYYLVAGLLALAKSLNAETPPRASLLVAPAEPEFYYLSGRLPTTPFVYLLPVDIPDFPLAQVTNDIRTKQFDVVVWSKVPPSSRTAPRYAAMLYTLERAYHAGPSGAPSMIIFTR